MSKPENPPAFPECNSLDDQPGWLRGGMSLRDWFAGMALQGICTIDRRTSPIDDTQRITARTAYQLADAMLAERERNT